MRGRLSILVLNLFLTIVYFFIFRYNLIILLTTYCIPISGMTYAYFRIGIVLWSSKSIGEYCTDKQLESIKSKRKVCSFFCCLKISFPLCYNGIAIVTPLHYVDSKDLNILFRTYQQRTILKSRFKSNKLCSLIV